MQAQDHELASSQASDDMLMNLQSLDIQSYYINIHQFIKIKEVVFGMFFFSRQSYTTRS